MQVIGGLCWEFHTNHFKIHTSLHGTIFSSRIHKQRSMCDTDREVCDTFGDE